MPPLLLGLMDGITKAINKISDMLCGFFDVSIVTKKIVSNEYGVFKDSTQGATVKGMMYALKPVGYGLLIIFFGLMLIDLGMLGKATMETIGQQFIKLAVGIIMVDYSWEFVSFARGLGGWISDLLIPNPNDEIGNVLGPILMTAINGESSWISALLSIVLVVVIGFIAGLICTLCCYIICFSRLIEMAIQAVLMPIALSFLGEQGYNGSAGRWIKGFIATCAQGAVLVIISSLGQIILGSIATDHQNTVVPGAGAIMSILPMLGALIATVAMMFKSQGIVKSAFGAQ